MINTLYSVIVYPKMFSTDQQEMLGWIQASMQQNAISGN